MATDVVIPDMGESVTEAILVKWLKQSGEAVAVDEPLCVLETDKADVELPAPTAGVLTTTSEPGDTIQVGATVATIDESATPSAPTASDPASKSGEADGGGASARADAAPAASGAATTAGRADSGNGGSEGGSSDSGTSAAPAPSPAVRRLLVEHDLDAAAIAGSGKGGRLTKQDVLAHVADAAADAGSSGTASGSDAAAAPAPAARTDAGSKAGAAAPASANGERREPMSKLRRRIAQRLVAVKQQTAMLTTFNEIDMSAVMDMRSRHKERFAEQHGVGLGFMSFFGRASALALGTFPRINAQIDDTDIVYHDAVNLGIAVSTERGLVVPVIRNADQLSFAQLEREVKRLATSAREGNLELSALSGGTFTITNGGVFGSLLSTPILNPPQSGILGMHTIQRRPVAVGEQVEIRPMMYVALSYDHRIVDGRESVSFLVRLKELLEDPARLLLEI